MMLTLKQTQAYGTPFEDVWMNKFLRRLLFLEIRMKRRWRSIDGIFTSLQGTGSHRVDEIGLGGLSFHYSDEGLLHKEGAYGLSIHTHKPRFSIRLKGHTVSDQEVGELVFPNKKIKRRSVCFEPLNRDQKKELKALIRHNLARSGGNR